MFPQIKGRVTRQAHVGIPPGTYEEEHARRGFGEFMSRHGIGPGAFTLHPQGIHHGPHPKAFESARARAATNEVAVLVETTRPLRLTAEAEKAEDPTYATNWAQ